MPDYPSAAPLPDVAPESSQEPHSLTFRVMRLTIPLPSSVNTPPFIVTSASPTSTPSPSASLSEPPPLPAPVPLPPEPRWQAEGARCGVGSLTVLPPSFGSIHASEQFRSFISAFNRSTDAIYDVNVTIHMQTPSSKRITLSATSSDTTARAVMSSRASINNIVQLRLDELGTHVLVCTATYRTIQPKPQSLITTIPVRTLRQYFKFTVLPPVDATVSVLPLFRNAFIEQHHSRNRKSGAASVVSIMPLMTNNKISTLHNNVNFNINDPTVHMSMTANSSATQFLVHVRINNPIAVSIFDTAASLQVNAPLQVRALHAGSASGNKTRSSTTTTMEEEMKMIDFQQGKLRGRNASLGTGDSRNFVFLLFSYIPDSKRISRSSATPLIHSSTSSSVSGSSSTTSPSPSPSSRGDVVVGSSSNSSTQTLTLTPNGITASNSINNKNNNSLGVVKITWRSGKGEKGQVEKEVIENKDAKTIEDVSVDIYAVPHQVDVHHPFVARCAARNNSAQTIRMYLQIRRDLVSEIVPVGVSGTSLGEVKPNETAYCAISLIGLVRGQHNICGVRIVDMDSNASYKAEPTTITVN